MTSFELRSVCNELLGELNESMGKQNIIKLGVDVQLPDQYHGCPLSFVSTIRAVTKYLSGSLINGIINIEITQQAALDSLINLNVQIAGLGSSRKNGKDKSELMNAIGDAGLKVLHKVSEDRITIEFNQHFKTLVPVSPVRQHFQNKNILLVEDNAINALVFMSFLDEWGCKTTNPVNGLEAVSQVHVSLFPVDAILMDIHMPVMNGIEATRQIRQLNATVPIIALTASTREEDIREAMAAGANDYLLKPVSSSQLFQVLSKYL